MKKLISLFALTLAFGASASTVAIIDSGTDLSHEQLKNHIWMNPIDYFINNRDEDGNGYPDDVNGWNFAENNNLVIDMEYMSSYTPEVAKFFAIQTKAFLGQATPEEIAWFNSQIENTEFIQNLQIFGNFMHGTHVAGIAAKDAVDAKILAIKLIPTEVKLPFNADNYFSSEDKGLVSWLMKQALGKLAEEQTKVFGDIGAYVNSHKSDVANGSFGTGYQQAEQIVDQLFNSLVRRPPTKEELNEITSFFIETMIEKGRAMMQAAPNTLFVFAAGNDNSNNDQYPTSPTNIKTENSISVAATLGNTALAKFSNYGATMVEVAAPGVGIESAIPGNNYMKVSGTSQAAPYVANVAAKVKDANPALRPAEIKRIIMETVDKKAFLKNKVVTSGVVNPERAVKAAELSLTMPIAKAIAEAGDLVDNQESFGPKARGFNPDVFVQPLPSMFR